MTRGTGTLTVGLHRYEMGPGDIAFLHPDAIMSWQTTSEETGGHFCLIHPDYFSKDADHVLQLLRQYPYLQPSRAVVHLDAAQSDVMDGHFARMYDEDRSDKPDRHEAIALHFQMVLLEARRAGEQVADLPVTETFGYVHNFLSLLETAFQLREADAVVKRKTAAEFADALHLHPNYLNALVKQHTGKTVREHIQERLLYEAKTLLLRTNWDISDISYGLGFSGNAAFTSFFKKKENRTPSAYRKYTLMQSA